MVKNLRRRPSRVGVRGWYRSGAEKAIGAKCAEGDFDGMWSKNQTAVKALGNPQLATVGAGKFGRCGMCLRRFRPPEGPAAGEIARGARRAQCLMVAFHPRELRQKPTKPVFWDVEGRGIEEARGPRPEQKAEGAADEKALCACISEC